MVDSAQHKIEIAGRGRSHDGHISGYPDAFDRDGSHDLTKVLRFESCRGFLFCRLNRDAAPLKEHLGETSKIIDMIVDQPPEGLEVLRASSRKAEEVASSRVAARPKMLWRTICANSRCQGSGRGTGK